jgi:hypothetical protein
VTCENKKMNCGVFESGVGVVGRLGKGGRGYFSDVNVEGEEGRKRRREGEREREREKERDEAHQSSANRAA